MRLLALLFVALMGLGGCVYGPYYPDPYYYYGPNALVDGAVVGGTVSAVVVADPGRWPDYRGGHYYRYPYARYRYARPYRDRPYGHGGYWRH